MIYEYVKQSPDTNKFVFGSSLIWYNIYMQIISNTQDFIIREKTVTAIGKFDGDHLGHQRIFEEMRRIRDQYGLKIAVFTFAPSSQPQIATINEKRMLLEKEGADYLIEYPFTDEVRMTDGKDFVSDILIGRINMAWIVAGDDCSFGYNRSGNAELLNNLSGIYNYHVTIINKLTFENTEISSSRIRECLSAGDVDTVHDLIGSYYSLSGTVTDRKPSELSDEFVTFSIALPYGKILPKKGVYASVTELEDGRKFASMTYIGFNSSITGDNSAHIECVTHIIRFMNETLYGQNVTISFIRFIRDELEFESIETLRDQLKADRNSILNILNETVLKGEK